MRGNDDAPMSGQLGRCSTDLQHAFRLLDGALIASGLDLKIGEKTKQGSWFARSYNLGQRKISQLHPKGSWLKVWVGEENFRIAPRHLIAPGEIRKEWLTIEPRHVQEALEFVLSCARRNAARL